MNQPAIDDASLVKEENPLEQYDFGSLLNNCLDNEEYKEIFEIANQLMLDDEALDIGNLEALDIGNNVEERENEEEDESRDDNDASKTQDDIESLSHANTYVAKDGTVWNKLSISYKKRSCKFVYESGPHHSTANLSIRDIFKCIFSNEMIDIIIRHTNENAKRYYTNKKKISRSEKLWKNLTVYEFDAFLGILITSGVNNLIKNNINDMWTSDPLYNANMNSRRFLAILQFICFDNAQVNTQVKHVRVNDIVTPILKLWTMLNSNLQKYYSPTKNLTIGEQLFWYRKGTNFIKYIPLQSSTRVPKVWWICDTKNYYPLAGEIYIDQMFTDQKTSDCKRIAETLITPYKGSGRNITMDNVFTTLPLAKSLLSWNLTIVGTLKENEAYIPQEIAPSNFKGQKISKFGFHKNVTICSYVKKRKAIILLSTKHRDTFGKKNKPDIVRFYKKTKFDVDKMSKMLRQYSTYRPTQKLPVIFFYNMLDIASLAAYIIYTENNKKQVTNEQYTHRTFLQQLGKDLCITNIKKQSINFKIPPFTRNIINHMLQKCTQNVIDETSLASTSGTPKQRKENF